MSRWFTFMQKIKDRLKIAVNLYHVKQMLGRLCPSLHFAPNSIVGTISGKWHALVPPPIFNVGIVHGVLHSWQVTIFFLENPTLIRGRGLSLKWCYLLNTFAHDCLKTIIIVNSFWRITQNVWQICSWYSPELWFDRLSLLLLLLGTILRLWNMAYPHMCFCEEGFCMTQYCVTAVSYAPAQQ